MNWDALSAAAELTGVVAVFVSLIYLAIQTRDNVKVQRARAAWDAQVSFVEVNDMLADGGKVSQLVFKGLSDPESLSDQDKYFMHRFARGWFQRMEAQFALYRAGILDAEVWQLRRGYAKAILENTLFKEFWEMDKKNSMFTKMFIDSIDNTSATEFTGFMGISR